MSRRNESGPDSEKSPNPDTDNTETNLTGAPNVGPDHAPDAEVVALVAAGDRVQVDSTGAPGTVTSVDANGETNVPDITISLDDGEEVVVPQHAVSVESRTIRKSMKSPVSSTKESKLSRRYRGEEGADGSAGAADQNLTGLPNVGPDHSSDSPLVADIPAGTRVRVLSTGEEGVVTLVSTGDDGTPMLSISLDSGEETVVTQGSVTSQFTTESRVVERRAINDRRSLRERRRVRESEPTADINQADGVLPADDIDPAHTEPVVAPHSVGDSVQIASTGEKGTVSSVTMDDPDNNTAGVVTVSLDGGATVDLPHNSVVKDESRRSRTRVLFGDSKSESRLARRLTSRVMGKDISHLDEKVKSVNETEQKCIRCREIFNDDDVDFDGYCSQACKDAGPADEGRRSVSTPKFSMGEAVLYRNARAFVTESKGSNLTIVNDRGDEFSVNTSDVKSFESRRLLRQR